jgi:hypothetical protein
MPVATSPLAGVVADSVVVSKRVDRVESRQVAVSGTSHLTGLLATPRIVPGMPPTCAVMPVVSVSDRSTPSTPSTPGKYCRLLTVAEKDSLLALFEADITLVEMEARVSGHEPANELRRAINVVWRLITVEGWDFDTATKLAVDWVVAQPMHPDELFFADVLTFSQGA